MSQPHMYLLPDLLSANIGPYLFKMVSVTVQPERQEAELLGWGPTSVCICVCVAYVFIGIGLYLKSVNNLLQKFDNMRLWELAKQSL